MTNYSNWLEKVLPPPRGNFMIRADLERGYKRFSRGLSLILAVFVLIPMTIIAVVSHYQHRRLFVQKEQEQLLLHLELSAGAVEKFVAELETVVRVVAVEDDYPVLSDPLKLTAIFERLHYQYPAFEEIEIIDTQGRRQSYVGADHGKERNYAGQEWYQQVVRQGVYISNAFTGVAQERSDGLHDGPHFFIAVSGTLPDRQKSWVMRVTVHAGILQDFIDTISTEYSKALFLVDAVCARLTSPGAFSRAGETCALFAVGEHTDKNSAVSADQDGTSYSGVSPAVEGLRISRREIDGRQVILAAAALQNIPWKLMLIKEPYLYGDAWAGFRIQLISVFVFCALVAVLLALEISEAITGHLQEAGLKREQFLARAEQPNKLASLGRLAAGVAHEINNPLSIINQHAGLIQDLQELSEHTDDFPYKKTLADALAGIQNSVARCKIITHRLLGFAHQTKVKIEEVDINFLLREAVDFLAEETAYSRIQIEFFLDQELSRVSSDRCELLQVFLNIISNAIDAIGCDGGKITLRSRQVTPAIVRISIADTGPGMASEVQQHIFDPFFTTKETGKGTGLGLSIVYGLIRKLGGTINVVSEVNKGTEFEIDLPVRQEEDE
ncbi:MAG: sensor histidine kinase [Candidatus Electrothrix sp. YB6]